MTDERKVVDYLRRVTADLHETRRRLSEVESNMREPIAIVGMACRYPGGVSSPEELWRLVADGADATSEFPTDRGWPEDLYDPDPDVSGKSYVRRGGFLDDVAGFDAEFFGISPREALAMDPQQRLLLEVSWEVLERAGLKAEDLRGSRTGVFIGASTSAYVPELDQVPDTVEGYTLTGNHASVLSGRVSYFLGLEGPSVTVDTACSSSLVALHLAVQALRQGECSLALAGGVTVITGPTAFIEFSRQRGLAEDGRCKPFSAAADGTSWAEGVGVLAVERLSDARRNGHRVLGVVRGSAVNQDGASSGLTVPNGPSQQRVIKAALENAGLQPQDVDAVEAHGTGTKLGDPIEAQALIAMYGKDRSQDSPLWLGSVKSNIGHAQASAGVAGVIKMVTALRNEALPPSLHAGDPTPMVDWSAGSVSLLSEGVAWPRGERVRRAGVSSFGVSGTNAHVIVEEAPAAEESAVEPVVDGGSRLVPWVVSGAGPGGLRGQVERLVSFLDGRPGVDVGAVAGALAGRAGLRHRLAVVGESVGELVAGLESVVGEGGVVAREGVRVGLLFAGQGAQWAGMGRELYEGSSLFAGVVDELCGVLDGLVGGSVREVMFGLGGVEGLLDQTVWAQAALFVLEVGLFRLVESWGVVPDVVVGHSVGEIAAAHVAGVLSVEDACVLVAARGRLMQGLPVGGAMVSVAAGVEVVEPLVVAAGAGVAVAAVNGPASTVVSGDADAVGVVVAACEERGFRTRRLRVSHAFHSARMDPMLDEFRSVVEGLGFGEARFGVVSTLLGRVAGPGELGRPEYWVRQVREPVLFAAAVGEAVRAGVGAFVEVGPGGGLTAMARECVGDGEVVLVPLLRKGRGECASVLGAAGRLWEQGVEFDWRAILPPVPAVELPTYAFDHTPYWLERNKNGVDVSGVGLREVGHGLVSVAVEVAAGDSVVLSGRLSAASHGWLTDHSVGERMVFPGSGFVELVVRAADEVGCPRIDELTLREPLLVPPGLAVDLQVVVDAADGDQRRGVAVYARPVDSETWTRHAHATVAPDTETEEPGTAPAAAWPPDGASPLDIDARYEDLRAEGYAYGPVFQCLRRAWRLGDEVLAEAELPQAATGDTDRFGLHPALWEAAAHAVRLTEPARRGSGDGALVPFSWHGVTLRATGATRLRLRVRPTGTETARVELADSVGEPVAVIERMAVRRTTADELTGAATEDADGLFSLTWTPVGTATTTGLPTGRSVPGPTDTAEAPAPAGGTVVLPALDGGATELPFMDSDSAGAAGQDAGIVVLPVLGGTAGDGDTEPATGAVAERLLVALQRWLADERNAARRLAVVTHGAVAAGEDTEGIRPDVTDLAASVAWGMMRTAQSEHPDRFLLLDLDVDPKSAGSDLADLVTRAARTGEPQLALRGETFLAPRLCRTRSSATPGSVPDPDGTVLITGGTGMLGRLVARHLVSTHRARHLLLVGRRGPKAPGAAELREELTALGAEVRIAACDVTDRAELAELLAGIPAEHALTTVVHAAGVTRNGVLADVEPQDLHTALRARVAGALNLHHLTRDLDLSAFVLFSSAAGTVGSSGHTGLAAAAAFLDALAHHRRAQGLNALSLVWGAWTPQGPSARPLTDADAIRLAREGAVPLPASEGLALFDAARTVEAAQLVASKIDASALRARAAAGVLSPLWHDLFRTPARRRSANDGDNTGSRTLARQLLDLGAEERNRFVVDLVRRHVAAVLGHGSPAHIDPQRGLMDAGFDSLTAVEFRNRLAADTGLQLPATLIFDHPTPTALAAFVLAETLGTSGDLDTDDTVTRGAADEPIAIVGMACRYPGGVASPEDLWRLVADGVDATSEFPADRGWPEDLYDPDPEASGKSYVRRGGFLDDVAGFDAEFFGISRREALAMDPQQRLLLEVSWEALERAGLKAEDLRGSRTGVFVGATASAYVADMDRVPETIEGYAQTGNTLSVLSGRVSYTFGFEGPSVSVDTACSSSLVALHLAVQALRQGECSLAMAGGVTVIASPGGFIDFSRQRALSPEGRCKPFAASADGTTWAEGVGLLMFERLSDARRNGHRVLGVVRGSAVNQDGASSGLTAPNGPSQQRVIRAALENAGLGTADVDAVEAHGTGTKLGDPIEAQALIATYGKDRPEGRPLWLGSMKSNIGHSVAAAGVAGVIKMVMALRNEALPPSLHAGDPTPMVDWSAGSVSLLSEGVAWPRGERVRRAGVSSFGVSGTNAHVIVEEAPAAEESAVEPVADGGSRLVPWVVSGAGPGGLRGQVERLVSFLDGRPGVDVGAVAGALAGRAGLRHRLAVVGESAGELVEGLESFLSGDLSAGAAQGVAGPESKVAFVFPGQGWQWVGMGVELLGCSDVFAEAVGECSAVVEELAGWSVVDVLQGAAGAPGFDRVDVVQPVMFTVMVALARLWESVGVVPSAVVGHSQGEIAAAHVAGVLCLEDALRVVVARSQALVEICGQGAMASVALGRAEVEERIAQLESVSVAAVNGPASTVVSGGAEEVAGLVAGLVAGGVRARRIDVDYASHSVHVEQVRKRIEAALAGVAPRAGRVPVYSTLTGEVLAGPEMDGGYWYANLRGRVEFEQAVRRLAQDGFTALVECSAHPVLVPGVEQTLETVPGAQVAVSGTLRRDDGGLRRFLTSAGSLWTTGVDITWPVLLPETQPVELPTYAFDRSRFWLERTESTGDVSGVGLGVVEHGLISAVVEVAAGGAVVLCGRLSRSRQRWLDDHAVSGQVLFPGTGFMDLVLRAADEVGCQVIEELVVQAPLVLPDTGQADLQIVIEPAGDDGRRQVVVYSRPAGTDAVWAQHAQAVIAQDSTPEVPPVGVWPPVGAGVIDVSGLYGELAERGYGYGPVFQGVRAAWRLGDTVYGEIALPESVVQEAARFGLHPALCDAAAHLLQFSKVLDQDGVWLPFAWNGVRLLATGATRARVRITPLGEGSVRMDLYDVAGEPLAVVEQLTARRLDPAELQPSSTSTAAARGLFALSWPALPTPDTPQPADTIVWRPQDSGEADTWGLPAVTDLEDVPASVQVVVLPVSGRDRDVTEVSTAVLAALQAWLAEDRLARARLAVVTRGAVAVDTGVGPDAGADVVDLAASGIWGMVRTAQSEHPDRFTLLDLDPHQHADTDALLKALSVSGEPQLAWRDGQLHAPRLVRALTGGFLAGVSGFGAGDTWRVTTQGTGSLDALAKTPHDAATRPLKPGEVRIEVRAAGLNFYDVAVALGMVDSADGLGAEGAGVVTETGPGVSRFAVGDRVLGAFPAAFAVRTIADERMLAPIPAGWSFEQAASVPAVFLTAYYALHDLAQIQPGQRVLIHAAAGGVGMAATQLARHFGADVYTTASPAKWHTLTALGIPEERIASSRTTDFAEQYLNHTGGSGMDIVLGSLSGEFVDASLRLLTPRGGRYIEMGKTDIRTPQQITATHPGITYRAFDLKEAGPTRTGEMLHHLLTLFTHQALTPLPRTEWDLARLPQALRHMSQARHTGKNVIRIPRPVNPHGTVLITGGTGTLGGLIARHLAHHHHMRHFLLLSRQGPNAPTAPALHHDLTQTGAQATITACDLTDPHALAKTLADIPTEHPLTAVIHATGHLDDATLTHLTPHQLTTVLTSKATTAHHLHHHTLPHDPAVFLLFSSAGSILGSPGQANYSTANTYLDALAHHRRHHNQPATSLAWGLWQQTSGMTSHLDDQDKARLARSALSPMSTPEALELFDAVGTPPHPLLMVSPLNTQHIPPHPVWQRLSTHRRSAASVEQGPQLAQQLGPLPPAQRFNALLDHIRRHTATILALPGLEAIDAHRGFMEQGLDSLTAVELRNRLSTSTGLTLPATTVFDHPSPAALTEHLLPQLTTADGPEGTDVTDVPGEEDIRRAIAGLSLAQLRDAGLFEPLMVLTGLGSADGADDTEEQSAIDDMDVDDLVQAALAEDS
ncbi:Erythronolide synthase, modules 3 and 4 [Streptomyces chartreusis NRRL 3882]|nr:Erythronolide synthase, modules 3 and 4 [Streptomyces chartreusis NRRL 3882]